MSKLVLVDGHSILNRAFYGVPLFTNSEGLHTNAVFGFLNILFKLIDDEKPDYLAIAFDVHQLTFRHEMFKDYKGTRKPMLPELREQVPVIKELLHKMNITTIELPGFEADDVIGTMSKIGEDAGMDVCVFSGDRDLLQLASDKVMICIPKTKKGQTTVEKYKTEEVKELYKVTPVEFIDVKALMGDSSDNIPGVPGIGEKGATTIIEQFGSIENAYEHAEEISNKRNKTALLEHYDMAQMSKVLATINRKSPVETKIEDCVFKDIYTADALDMIKHLEFKSMIPRFSGVTLENKYEDSFVKISQPDKAEELFNNLKAADKIGLYIYGNNDITGISICKEDDAVYFLPVFGFITKEYLIFHIRDIVNSNCIISVANIKENNDIFNKTILENDENSNLFDVEIAAYLINPLSNTYLYDDIARDYLGITLPSMEEIFRKKR